MGDRRQPVRKAASTGPATSTCAAAGTSTSATGTSTGAARAARSGRQATAHPTVHGGAVRTSTKR